ncbi:MAG: hypothetical protein H6Q72_3848 [Firmicutes bacterium]|nr:hypothetical protein [Bacillota bacterium]
MSNQVLLWGSIILPWLTLFFLKKEDIKRYMPVALFGALMTTIVGELALALKWWVIKDSIFPFYHMPTLTYGGFPVGIIWIFKFTNKKFFLFMLVNVAFDFGLASTWDKLLVSRGIIEIINATPFQLLLQDIINAALLYRFQMWQEGVLISPEKTSHSHKLQPAVAKPLPNDQEDNE